MYIYLSKKYRLNVKQFGLFMFYLGGVACLGILAGLYVKWLVSYNAVIESIIAGM